MKSQILFSGKNKKNIIKYRLLKNLPTVLSVTKISYCNKLTMYLINSQIYGRFDLHCWRFISIPSFYIVVSKN